MAETAYNQSVNEVDILDELISRLRYLETIKCRNEMLEEDRVKERQEVTIRFKKALLMKDFFNRASNELRAYKDKLDSELDDLYN